LEKLRDDITPSKVYSGRRKFSATPAAICDTACKQQSSTTNYVTVLLLQAHNDWTLRNARWMTTRSTAHCRPQ